MNNESEIFNQVFWQKVCKKYRLTPAEIKVVILYCRGFTTDAVAEKLKIKQGTLAMHRKLIYAKMRVKSLFQMLLILVKEAQDIKNN